MMFAHWYYAALVYGLTETVLARPQPRNDYHSLLRHIQLAFNVLNVTRQAVPYKTRP